MNTKILLLLVSFCFANNLLAQNSADSVRFCDQSHWDVSSLDANLTVRQYKSRLNDRKTYLFDTVQQIVVMEINPRAYRMGLIQEKKREKVKKLTHTSNAIAGINGGFFVVHSEPKNTAVANDFLKIDNKVYPCAGGWGNAAVAFDDASNAVYGYWGGGIDNARIEQWSASYKNVMVAGPMLIYNSEILHPMGGVIKAGLDAAVERGTYAPRTAIGSKADGTIVLMVVDGRSRSAYGASASELAAMGRWLGLVNMLNLDGGGSSTMVYDGRVLNFPSDGFGIIPLQRKVANALLVFPR